MVGPIKGFPLAISDAGSDFYFLTPHLFPDWGGVSPNFSIFNDEGVFLAPKALVPRRKFSTSHL